MVHASEVEQPFLAGTVVQPVDAVEVIATANRLPPLAAGVAVLGVVVKLVLGDARHPLEVPRHGRQDPRVAGGFVPRSQHVENAHVGPEVAPLPVVLRTKVAILPLTRQDGVHPLPGQTDDRLIVDGKPE